MISLLRSLPGIISHRGGAGVLTRAVLVSRSHKLLTIYIYIYSFFIHSLVIFLSIKKVDNYEPPTRSLLCSSLHHYIFSQTCPIHNILHPHSSRCTNFSFSLHITL